MTDGYALLRAIEANPDEDTPRLAFADWLEEHAPSDADRARAAFIRVQCEAARGVVRNVPADERRIDAARYDGLLRRSRELEAAHGAEWADQLPVRVLDKTFRRGFLDPVWVVGWELVRDWEALVVVAPLHTLRLFKTPLHTDRFAACPALRHVRRLDLTSNVIRVSHTRTLMASPHFVNLRAINFESNHIGLGGCQALAGAELPALESLALDLNLIGDRGLTALLGAPWMPRLKWLRAQRCGLSGPGVAALARSPAAVGLESLSLSGTKATPPATLALLADGAYTGLRRLCLYDTSANDDVAARLAAAPAMANLRELDLAATPITDRGARAILDSPHLRNLEALHINNSAFNNATRTALTARFRAELNRPWSRDEW